MLAGQQKFGLLPEACLHTAKAIQALSSKGVQVGIVIGGGNIFRGVPLVSLNLPRVPADQMGMLATLMNGIALQQTLNSIGCPTKLMSGLECPKVAEAFMWARAVEYLDQGFPVIFAGGTGNSFFTTDTTAALRACEVQADVLLKATKVDGIYDKDPIKHVDATKFQSISYSQMLAQKLEVMDATAVTMCRNGNIPILVFNMAELDNPNVITLLSQQNIGTLVTPG